MIRATTALALLLSLLVPAAAQADGPISLGVVPPVQMVPEDQSVTALRISLLYGRHADLTGLDLSLIGRNTGDVRGVAFAGASLVDGDFTGWQNGWLAAVTRGNLQGLQWAVYNRSGSGSSGPGRGRRGRRGRPVGGDGRPGGRAGRSPGPHRPRSRG
jgi:hypothetical protein